MRAFRALAALFALTPVAASGVIVVAGDSTALLQLMVKLGPLVTIEDVASCTVLDAGL